MIYRHVLDNLLSNRVRTLVSLSGIMVGVAALVVMLSIGRMAADFAINNLKNMGSNLLSVSLYNSKDNIGITSEQLDFLLSTKGVVDLSAFVHWPVSVDVAATIVGVDSNIFKLLNISVAQGRVILSTDIHEPFCVIGHDIAKQLKKKGIFPVLGSWLDIGNSAFEVVGILNKSSSNYFISFDLDHSILVSRTIAMHFGGNSAKLNSVIFKIKPNITSKVQSYLNNIFKQWYKAQIFFRNSAELIKQIQEQKQSFNWLLTIIAIISLLLGGVGVMNIMLVALSERKQEIGLRMALGATERDIQFLFLLESIILSLIGGVFGLLIGLMLAFILTLFTGWSFTVDYMAIGLSFILSILSGLFGLLPALQSSSMDLQKLFTSRS